jgi:site-specific recombinase XerD
MRQLRMRDVVLEGPHPGVDVRRCTAKGKKKGRFVPSIDTGSLQDLKVWADHRRKRMGAEDDDPFICCIRGPNKGKKPIDTRLPLAILRKTLFDLLGKVRGRQIRVHSLRHSFCSHALAKGYSVAQIRDFAGHDDISITCRYIHSLPPQNLKDLFPIEEIKEKMKNGTN